MCTNAVYVSFLQQSLGVVPTSQSKNSHLERAQSLELTASERPLMAHLRILVSTVALLGKSTQSPVSKEVKTDRQALPVVSVSLNNKWKQREMLKAEIKWFRKSKRIF